MQSVTLWMFHSCFCFLLAMTTLANAADSGQDIERVIDKVCDKLEPVAKDAVQQYAEREAYLSKVWGTAAVISTVLFVLLALLSGLMIRFIDDLKDKMGSIVYTLLLSITMTIAIIVLALAIMAPAKHICHAANAKAPIVGLMESVGNNHR